MLRDFLPIGQDLTLLFPRPDTVISMAMLNVKYWLPCLQDLVNVSDGLSRHTTFRKLKPCRVLDGLLARRLKLEELVASNPITVAASQKAAQTKVNQILHQLLKLILAL